jgi:hypothetical protein
LLEHPGVDLVTYPEPGTVVVEKAGARARVERRGDRYRYRVEKGDPLELAAVAGALFCILIAVRNRRRTGLLAPLALFAAGALPAYAFFDGHPFRIRYMTPLVPALAVCAGLGRFGAILWVKPRDVRKAAATLGAA